MSQIILKSGTSNPTGLLATAEPAIDLSTGKFYIGGDILVDTSAVYIYSDDSQIILDASLGDIFIWDGSGYLDVSIVMPTDFYSQAYVDGSLNDKADTSAIPTDFYSQSYVDGSLNEKLDAVYSANNGAPFIGQLVSNTGYGGQYAEVRPLYSSNNSIAFTIADSGTTVDMDVSIFVPTDFYSQAYVDGSLNAKVNQTLFDSSIGALVEKDLQIDASLNDITDITGLFVKNASLGTDFYYDTGLLEVSIFVPTDFYSQTYVDGSLNAKANKTDVDSSFGLYKTRTNIDASMANIYLKDLVNVTVDNPEVDDRIAWTGSAWANVPSSQISGGNGVSFFLDDSDSSIAGYNNLTLIPVGGVEQYDSSIINNQTVLLETYISPEAGLGSTAIDGGQWVFNIYANCSATNIGPSKILVSTYSRDASGTETKLFDISTGILGTVVTLEAVRTVQPAFTIVSTDRLVTKFYLYTERTSDTTVGYYHNGTSHYTNIVTPLVVRHNDLAGLQGGTSSERYHLTGAELTAAQGIRSYVDGSLNAKVNQTLFDSSIASLTNKNISQDASIIRIDSSLWNQPMPTDFYSQAYVDASLNVKLNALQLINNQYSAYTVVAGDLGKLLEIDASMVVTLPDSLDTGFRLDIVNASDGYVTLDASVLLTTDSSVQLQNQYAGATVVHKGSGTWYAWGNLKG